MRAPIQSLNLETLLALADQGDQVALGKLLEEHRSSLESSARRFLGQRLQTRVDVADLVQQTFLSAVERFGDFRIEAGVSGFGAWLNRIHQRNIANCLRWHVIAARRTIYREESVHLDRIGSTLDSAPGEECPSCLTATDVSSSWEQLLSSLPVHQREAVRLRFIEGLSIAQIALRIQRSDSAVDGLIKRGIRKLRKLYSPDEVSPYCQDQRTAFAGSR